MTCLNILKDCWINFILQKFIITAAHCCDGQNFNELKVVAGDHNIKVDEGTEQVKLL